MRLIQTALICTAALIANVRAQAAPPSACAARANLSQAYTSGFVWGKALVRGAWANVGNCTKFDYLAGLVQNNISQRATPRGSQWVTCRATGLGDGARAELDSIRSFCKR